MDPLTATTSSITAMGKSEHFNAATVRVLMNHPQNAPATAPNIPIGAPATIEYPLVEASIAAQTPPKTMRAINPGALSRLGVDGNLSTTISARAATLKIPTEILLAANSTHPGAITIRPSIAIQHRTAIGVIVRKPVKNPTKKSPGMTQESVIVYLHLCDMVR